MSDTRRMAAFLDTALHDGSPWLVVACFVVFAGVVAGLYTRDGSGISSHPYGQAGDGGDLGTDMPSEATGREELETILWPRRAGRRARRGRS
jgi:hypothetical protein